MDEIDALRQMRTALAQEEHPDRLALRTDWRPGSTPRRRRRGLTIPLVSVAATAAAVTADALLVPGGPGGRVVPRQTITAGNVLLVAASNAETAPAGRYWHTETVTGTTQDVGKTAADHYPVDLRQRSVIWVGPDGKRRVAIVDEGGHPMTPQDTAKWRQAGSPKMVKVPDPEGHGSVFVDMRALSSNGRHAFRSYDGTVGHLPARVDH